MGGWGRDYLILVILTDINGLIWGCMLLARAIFLEILLLLTFTHNLCDDACEEPLWIYILSAF